MTMNNNTIHKLDFRRRSRRIISERFTVDTTEKSVDSTTETIDMTYNSIIL